MACARRADAALSRSFNDNLRGGNYGLAAASMLLRTANVANYAFGLAAQQLVAPGNSTYNMSTGFATGDYSQALHGSTELLLVFGPMRLLAGAGAAGEAGIPRTSAPSSGVEGVLAAPTRLNPWHGRTISTVAETDMKMYRVWGGDAQQAGGWLTPFKPTSAASARAALALPEGNAATFVSEVTVPAGTRFQFGQASATFGQPGGGWQVELLDKIPETNFSNGAPLH